MSGRPESRLALVRRARAMFRALGELYPDAHCELDFRSPLELLVATILSAQSTDKGVNLVTPELFRRYPEAAAYAAADRDELERLIKPTGFFRNKADTLIRLGGVLVAEFDARVPDTMDELLRLPGVGRKTANVVLTDAFEVPGITTDTHVIRLAHRFGWTEEPSPEGIERALGELFPRRDWRALNHRVIWHGRRRCHARRPACGACSLARWCPSYGLGPIDPVVAATLVREPRG